MTQIRWTVNSSGGRVRIPAGQPGAGRFAKGGSAEYRQALRHQNAVMARELQAEVIDNMRSSIIRRQVSTGRLLQATADPRNIESSEFHVGVGREDYLNQSIAKYWRTIEEGSQVVWADVPSGRPSMVGMELRGFWGGSLGRVTANRAYGARPWSRHSARRSDMFVPAKRFREAGRFAKAPSGSGGRGGAPSFVKSTVIKNEIAPHNDYEDAFRSYQPGARGVHLVNELLAKASRAAWAMES